LHVIGRGVLQTSASVLRQENAPALLRRRAGAREVLLGTNQGGDTKLRLLDKRQRPLPVPDSEPTLNLAFASNPDAQMGSAALAPVAGFSQQPW
jgi:hypothetical protein